MEVENIPINQMELMTRSSHASLHHPKRIKCLEKQGNLPGITIKWLEQEIKEAKKIYNKFAYVEIPYKIKRKRRNRNDKRRN